MIRHYWKAALKQLEESKLLTVINVLGPAVGLAASIIIFLYVQSERSYDKHWVDADNIYKLMLTEAGAEIDLRVPVGAAVVQEYFGADVAQTAVLKKANFSQVAAASGTFVEDVDFVNQSFVDIFSLELITGDIRSIFHNPNALALSEESALLWFGEPDVVGERLAIKEFFQEQAKDYEVVAVFRQPEGNSTIDVQAMGGLPVSEERLGGHELYLKLTPQADPEAIRARLPDFVRQYASQARLQVADGRSVSDVFRFHLLSIRDLYFNPVYCAAWNAIPCGSFPAVAAFAAIAVLVLLTACVNYVVLALSKAGQRAREVAIRKASGAATGQLVVQFLIESFTILMLPLVLALTLVDIFLPFFESVAGNPAPLHLTDSEHFLLLPGLIGVLSVLAGLYPSLSMARFHPAVVLQSHRPLAAKGFNRLQGSLLVFQFSASIGLLIATLIVFGQLMHTKRLDVGFSPDNVLQIAVGRPELQARAQALRQAMLGSTKVQTAALTGMDVTESGAVFYDEYKASRLPAAGFQRIPTIPVDFGFFETLAMPLVAGRYFEPGRDRPESEAAPDQGGDSEDQVEAGSVVINEAALKLLGFAGAEDALDQAITSEVLGQNGSSERRLSIVGVVADSQYRSLRREAGPEVFVLSPGTAFFLMVRINNDDSQGVLDELERIWRNVMGDAVFERSFVADKLASAFLAEKNQGVLLITFALLSTFISCLGLYGVTALTVDRRSKEIAIRKVFGSDLGQLVWLFCRQFSKYILLANIIAWPVALGATRIWLQRFPYQLDDRLLVPLCVLAAFVALSIAWLTVAAKTVKVADMHPLPALRHE